MQRLKGGFVFKATVPHFAAVASFKSLPCLSWFDLQTKHRSSTTDKSHLSLFAAAVQSVKTIRPEVFDIPESIAKKKKSAAQPWRRCLHNQNQCSSSVSA